MKKPTYEEFEEAVSKRYKELCKKEDFEKYYQSDEAKEQIEKSYKYNLWQIERGKSTYDIAMQGGVDSCAWCLHMMTE